MTRSERIGNLIWPLLLIIVLVATASHSLGLVELNLLSLAWRLWPLLLVVAAANILLTSPLVFFPLLLLAFGAGLLLNNYDLASWNMWLLTARGWPLIFVALGLDLIVAIWRGAIEIDGELLESDSSPHTPTSDSRIASR